MFSISDIRPRAGDKYFITRNNGGFSPCISIPGSAPDLDAIPNCVGFAVGQFNKIANCPNFPYLANSNAENQLDIARGQGLKISETPTLGGAMVWAHGAVWNPGDGAGHIAICIGVNPDGSVVSADSAYMSTPFYTKERSGANYGQNAKYKYLGCVVNPGALPGAIPATTLKRGSRGAGVKWLQNALINTGHSCGAAGVDGIFGAATEKAVFAFQIRFGLTADGVAGRITKTKLYTLYNGA